MARLIFLMELLFDGIKTDWEVCKMNLGILVIVAGAIIGGLWPKLGRLFVGWVKVLLLIAIMSVLWPLWALGALKMTRIRDLINRWGCPVLFIITTIIFMTIPVGKWINVLDTVWVIAAIATVLDPRMLERALKYNLF